MFIRDCSYRLCVRASDCALPIAKIFLAESLPIASIPIAKIFLPESIPIASIPIASIPIASIPIAEYF